MSTKLKQGHPGRFTVYPDGAFEETTYVRLDVANRRHHKGRLTHSTYNEPAADRDAGSGGAVIQQQFCPCGALDALIDANGNPTKWDATPLR